MAVHCSSNVILLAIDSKGERQNIKLLSTQNNYSPSFGLKKLVIFFISSDKTDKKLCRSWKYNTRCRTKRRGGQGKPRHGVWSRGKSALGHNYREKHKSPTKCLAFEIKENTENVAEYRRKKTCFKYFFYFNYFSFQRKKWGQGRKKVVGPRPNQPLPHRGPCTLKDELHTK